MKAARSCERVAFSSCVCLTGGDEILQNLAHGGHCRRTLGNSSAEKVLAAQFLPRVKLFIGALGSRWHFYCEILQKPDIFEDF